ncbi:hypothetical protein, partial [Streptosporangium canum]|uniref:hypothetical protein n=1 Tax=Streptosporangium canum TaxID=324952 RepID=UPI003792A5D3
AASERPYRLQDLGLVESITRHQSVKHQLKLYILVGRWSAGQSGGGVGLGVRGCVVDRVPAGVHPLHDAFQGVGAPVIGWLGLADVALGEDPVAEFGADLGEGLAVQRAGDVGGTVPGAAGGSAAVAPVRARRVWRIRASSGPSSSAA